MKTRLLPVLLLTATFPFAALAQSSNTSPSGTGGTSSSSNNDTGTSNNTTSSPGTGGTSSTSNSSDTSGSAATPGAPGTGGTSAASSGTGAAGADGSGTGATSTSGSAGVASAETFVTIPGSGAWRVGDLQGKTVYSVDGANIGEINDILVSQNGSVNAVIIGVGGFLGMGEKNVAVNVSALQMAPSEMTGATGTDSSNSAGTAATSPAGAKSSDRIVLNVTRDQLEKAPAFTGMMSK
ncbi:PRC-barrel domain-containing protein [Pleomorphomonas sp. PLEO]|uniref:PRC-barrel domain-containing protein n=1 Tax=Pleomorphomonas sp. PLEO TaxID=3239306 RepID=UPI00351EA369